MKCSRLLPSHRGGSLGGAFLALLLFSLGTADGQGQCFSPLDGLLGWWPGEGNTYDRAGTNHGSPASVTGYAKGIVGNAFSIEATNNRVIIPYSTSLTSTGGMSFEAWIYPKEPPMYWQTIGAKTDTFSVPEYQLSLVRPFPGDLIYLEAQVETELGPLLVRGTNVIPLNAWTHVAATYDGKILRLYVDGNPDSTVTGLSPMKTGTAPLHLGVGRSYTYSGLIDEPSLYGRALTSGEVLALYMAREAGKCPIVNKPAITQHPAGLALRGGTHATFAVTATGSMPLYYQWYLNGLPVPGATSGSLTVSNTQPMDGGLYSVVVTNEFGSAVSSNAMLTLGFEEPVLFDDFDPDLDLSQWVEISGLVQATNYGGFDSAPNSLWFGGDGPRYIVTRPLNTISGGMIEFHLQFANGSEWPWEKPDQENQGIVIEWSADQGTNWNVLQRYYTMYGSGWSFLPFPIPDAARSPATQFRWRQLNHGGAAFDHWALDNVRIYLGPATPIITRQPQSLTVPGGSDVTFTVEAIGAGPLSYTWVLHDYVVLRESLGLLRIPFVVGGDAGTYQVTVYRNNAGFTLSSNVVLTVTPPLYCADYDRIVSWWRGERDASDAMGRNDGVGMCCFSYWKGRVGQTFGFDGTRGGINVGDNPSLHLQDFTIESWVARGHATFISWDGDQKVGHLFGYSDQGYAFTIDESGRLSLRFSDQVVCRSGQSVQDTDFHHLAATRSGSNVCLYIDGAIAGTGVFSGTLTFSGPAWIGGLRTSETFYGAIDELSVYEQALTRDQIAGIFAAWHSGKCAPILPPYLLSEPEEQIAATGAGLVLQVRAGGTEPLTYQWSLNGTNIPGATNAILWLPEVAASDAGQYRAIVSNPQGAVATSNATVRVITWQHVVFDDFEPQANVSMWADFDTNHMAANAYGGSMSGSNSLWFRPGGRHHITTVPVNTSQGGFIQFNLRMANGRYDENWGQPNQPQTVVLRASTNAGSSWFELGRYTLEDCFRWARVVLPIPLEAQATNAQFRWSQTEFTPVVGNWALDDVLIASGPMSPLILDDPLSQVVTTGDEVTFSVSATAILPLSFQWQLNGTDLPGETNQFLRLANAQSLHAGTYTVKVSTEAGSLLSRPATLAVLPVIPCSPAPDGLVRWWRAQSNTLDTVVGAAGLPIGSVHFGPGLNGSAFSFEGTGQIRIGDQSILHATNELTLEAWVWPLGVPKDQAIVGQWESGKTNTPACSALTLGTDGRACFAVNGLSSSSKVVSVNVVPANTWSHVVATYDRQMLKLYLNGTLQAQSAFTNSLAPGVTDIGIGGLMNGNDPQAGVDRFYGRIDEVSLYSRALAHAEILALYAATNSGKCAGPTPPAFFVQPTNQTARFGDNIVFATLAGGSPPLHFQWLFNGEMIPGATNASLTLTSVAGKDSGDYQVIATNSYGSTASSNALLLVHEPALFIYDDFDQGVNPAFWSGLGGSPQATTHGGAVSQPNALWFGGDGSRFATTIPVDTREGGMLDFQLRFSNGYMAPWEAVDLPGEGVVLEYSTNDGLPGSWVQLALFDTTAFAQWTRITRDLPPQAWSAKTLFRWRQLSHSGAGYDHWALDNVSISGAPVAPVITVQPAGASVVRGGSVTLTVLASGTLPLSYQWRFNGSAVPGANQPTLVLTNVQPSQAGLYSVAITNRAGWVLSDDAALQVTVPSSIVQLLSSNLSAGTTGEVSIVLVSLGNAEAAVGFTLNFPSDFTYAGTAHGRNATNATFLLNNSQLGSGTLGVALALAPDTFLPPGTNELLVLKFSIPPSSSSFQAEFTFSDQPVIRRISDIDSGQLPAVFVPGLFPVQPTAYEADVAPRPNGDNALTVTDWVLLGRYAARLDVPSATGEFQRADCAPKTTFGDGRVGIADWVQAGRYAVGLDPLEIAAGPISELPIVPAPDELDHPSRRLSIQSTEIFHGLTGSVSVYLESLGNENAFGFSLDFDPDVLQFCGAALAADCAHAFLHLNTNLAHSGKIGVALSFPTGSAAKPGIQQLLILNFEGVSAAPATSCLRFSNDPVNREVVDPEATVLPVDYLDGTLLLHPVPNLAATLSGDTIELSWPASAGSFLLQESSSIYDPAAWRTVAVPPVLRDSRLSVTIPLQNASRFYRLVLPSP